jgi:hypothetical protein
MVIFVFLRNFWATVIPAITVPLSLIGTFAVLYELGYTLDNLSLMALSIAIGFVVDDAVVVIENIVRHMEGGLSPMEAAQRIAGDRLHHRLDHVIPNRSVHPLISDGRLCRQAFSGICHHGERFACPLARNLSDAHANDVRTSAQA